MELTSSDIPRSVYMYWSGYEYKLIKLLRKLVQLHSEDDKAFKFTLITPENIREYIHELPNYFYSLLPAHQADYVRVNVICDRGGIWLDSDPL